MCFSATASFSAAAVLAAIGTWTMRAARSPRERPFAAMPFLFAAQQAVEGALWLRFHHDATATSGWLVHAYLLFSHVLWPVFVPLSVALIEPRPMRRRALAAMAVVGAVVAVWLFDETMLHGVTARPNGAHIDYVSQASFVGASTTLYVVATVLAPLVSSHRVVRLFGALALAAFALTLAAYEAWLVSVWCFFAACLSSVVVLHLRPTGRERAAAGA